MELRTLIFTVVALMLTTTVTANEPERAAMARSHGKRLTVKEWKTTPDGRNKWIDHIEVYNAQGLLVEEIEYSDFGRHQAWRSEYTYNSKGELVQEVVYNERNKIDKVRKFEYDADGVCTRRLNYNANGTLNSYRQFEYTYE
ncbi:MAG: hypothetical protein IJ464_04255 [Alistipes sp.]|nr:hypothetical protein [Alistipes sp.]